MKKFQYCLTLLAAAVSVFLLSAAPVRAADQEQGMEVGKKDEIMFETEVQIGDLTLAPGHYRLQHRAEGPDHFVQFTLLKGVHNTYNMGGRPTGTQKAGEVRCRVEPLDQKVTKTLIYSRKENGAMRITRILVHGENVAHVF